MRIPTRIIIVLFTVMSLFAFLWIYHKPGSPFEGTYEILHTFARSDDNLKNSHLHYSNLILDHEFPNCQDRTIYNGYAEYSLPDIVRFIRQYIPPPSDFIGHLKNPCWFANYDKVMSDLLETHPVKSQRSDYLLPHANGAKTLYCLPYMYLLGYPKCGTTSLLSYFRKHPEFVKSFRGFGWIGNYTAGLINKYPDNVISVFYLLKNFYPAARQIEKVSTDDNVYNKIIADFNPSISWRQNGFEQFKNGSVCDPPLLLRELQPNAKFVVLLREPISRLYSAFWYYATDEYKENLSSKIFSKDVHTFFERLQLCDNKKSMLKCLKEAKDFDNHFTDSPRYPRDSHFQLITGFYYLYLLPWLQVFPRKNFMFVRTEDMKKDTGKTLQEIFQFLGMSTLSDDKIETITKIVRHEQTMLKDNSEMLLSSSTKKQLRAYFRPFNEKLAELLNEDKFLWDDID